MRNETESKKLWGEEEITITCDQSTTEQNDFSAASFDLLLNPPPPQKKQKVLKIFLQAGNEHLNSLRN